MVDWMRSGEINQNGAMRSAHKPTIATELKRELRLLIEKSDVIKELKKCGILERC